jgi:hypothetical protein
MVVGFEQLKAVGKVAERAVAEAFLDAGWWVQLRHHGARRDLAVMLGSRVELLEVKNEEKHAHTGNICVEIFQGEPPQVSGVMTSESTIYIHYFGDSCLVMRTQLFRLFLDTYFRQRGMIQFREPTTAMAASPFRVVFSKTNSWAVETATKDIPSALAVLTECPTVPPRLNGRGGA